MGTYSRVFGVVELGKGLTFEWYKYAYIHSLKTLRFIIEVVPGGLLNGTPQVWWDVIVQIP